MLKALALLVLVSWVGLVGCQGGMPLELGHIREEVGENTVSVWLEVKTEPKAAVRCTPDCGNMTADDSGSLAAWVFLKEEPGPQTIRVDVSRPGLSWGSASKTIEHSLSPRVGIASNEKGVAKFRCVLTPCSGEVVFGSKPKLVLTAPPGTAVELGGLRATVPAGGVLETAIPIADLFASTSIQEARDSSDGMLSVDAQLRIEPSGGPTLETKVPAKLPYGDFFALLREVEKSPVAFANEPEELKKPASVLVLHESGDPDVVGGAKTFRDAAFVARRDKLPRDVKCGTYVAKSGARAQVEIDVHDAVIKVYERRTGKLRGERKFFGASGCPDTTQKYGPGDTIELWGGPDEALITAWLKTFL